MNTGTECRLKSDTDEVRVSKVFHGLYQAYNSLDSIFRSSFFPSHGDDCESIPEAHVPMNLIEREMFAFLETVRDKYHN